MRAVLVAAALISTTFAQSGATLAAYINFTDACAVTATASLQGRQDCSSAASSLTTLASDPRLNGVLGLCTSTCYTEIRTAYINVGTCLKTYRATLVANLQADNVPSPEVVADRMIFKSDLGAVFDFYCLRGEDYCYPMIDRLRTDALSPIAHPSVMDPVCSYYYNGGCCLASLDALLQTQSANVSFSGGLAAICPAVANISNPTCVGYKQRALTLAVTVSLTGLDCSAYMDSNATVIAQYRAALKLDLANGGVNAGFVTVVAVYVANNGECTMLVNLRADNETATEVLRTAAGSLNTVTLTNANSITARYGLGTVTSIGAPKVTTTFTLGQSADSSTTPPNSANLAAPSSITLLAAAVLVWIA